MFMIVVDLTSGLYDLITLDFLLLLQLRFMENFEVLYKIVLLIWW